ncbi:MAG TPA: hypothetical protein PKD90_08495, partial [Phnomibacter sp.]|nr:hypothetical protein [Phnomibacter sp.]
VWVLAAIIITNVTLLFARHLLLNLLITAVALVLAVWAIHGNATGLIKRLVQAGAYLLVLGLCIEATEGGIKKDPSTYSYYFVTSGLAMLLLALLHLLQNSPTGRTSTRLLATNGQNPMVAYVAGNLLLTPALHLTGIMQWHNQLTGHWALGLLKGLLFTSVVFLITWLFTKNKWYWKT